MSQPASDTRTDNDLPRYWDDELVDHFITSEAHAKNKTPEQFKETHVDIDRIYADNLTPIGVSGDFVTQEHVLESITRSNLNDPNRIFIVRGEPGAGKSQLCEWLRYRINGYGDEDDGVENYEALHVSRSQTQIDQIIKILTEPLGIDKNVRNIQGSNPHDLADPIVGLLRGYWPTDLLSDEELHELTEKRDDHTDLREIFAKNIEEYQRALDSRDENPDFQLLTKHDYRELRLTLSFGDKLRENQDLIFPSLKNQAHEYLSDNLVGNFKEQLQEYSEKYLERGIRPVLICEDLTTFSVLKEQLLDHIFELSSSNFDIVLGWTIGWEQDNLNDAFAREDAATYMRGRCEGYLTMTDEKGEAYFLDDDVSVALARSYLDAIKRNSSGSGVPEEVEAAFDGLYPFNEHFIHVAYRQLNDEGGRKTPRLLLLRVVKHCLKSSLLPYEAMKTNPFVDTPTFAIDMKYDQIYQDISRWYGVPVEDGATDGGIGVKVGIFETFGIDLPDSSVAHVKGDYVVFKKGKGTNIIDKIKNPPTPNYDLNEEEEQVEVDDEIEDDEEEVVVVDETELTEEQREQQRKVQEFQDWVTSGEAYPSSDTLHAGAVAALERWHDPTRLSNPNASTRSAGAIYHAKGNTIPVSIQGDQQRQSTIDVELEYGTDHADLYTPMLEYGLFGMFDPETTNFDQLRAWADTNVAQFKHDMRAEVESCLPGDLTIEKTLILAQFFLINAGRGAEIENETLSSELVFEEYDSNQPYGKPIVEHFNKDSAFGHAFTNLSTRSSDIADLIEGFFLLKSNVVDFNRLSAARQEVAANYVAYVDAAMMIDIGDLADAYKIGTTRNQARTKVSTLLKAVSDYAKELDRLTVEEDAAHIQSALKPVERWFDSSHRVDQLAEWFETLRTCAGAMDVPISASCEEAYNILTESPEKVRLTDFRSDLETFQEMEDASGVELVSHLHDYARSRHEQEAWKIYEAFDSLICELQDQDHAEGVNLDHRIKQLSEFSEYEKKRQSILSITKDI
ncbi:hypothetical protein [Haladaptatus sp. ZSTT2]|uniref:hypothetical protein n=1 Tax=Haladaptatus sp. ZSTT2 TaxID=3120515 RepID=UPI00300F3B6D